MLAKITIGKLNSKDALAVKKLRIVSNNNVIQMQQLSRWIFLPELMLGLTVLSYLVLRYSAKLIETFTVPVTVSSVAFVSLKSQNRNSKLFYNHLLNLLISRFHYTVNEPIKMFYSSAFLSPFRINLRSGRFSSYFLQWAIFEPLRYLN